MKQVDLESALKALKNSEIVIYPTETTYGLGVDIKSSDAIKNLFKLKKRSLQQAISILVSSLDQAKEYVSDFSPLAQTIWQTFMPGPLTLVLPANTNFPRELNGGSDWVGIRYSSHRLAQNLVERYQSPITTSSANLSGQLSAITEDQVKSYFQNENVYFLPGGELKSSPGSTVIQVKGDLYQVLREGEISQDELKVKLGF